MATRRARPGNPRTAIAYLRASTAEQHLGPEAQRAAIEAWASREGVTVVAWHVDAGVSGGSALDNRPALGAALGELRVHGAGLLLVAKRDRLARDSAVAIAVERAVDSCGARVVSADGNGNGEADADLFLRRIIDAAAEYERRLIRSRTRAALAAKKARGERAGEAPFGFKATPEGRLTACAAEQGVVSLVKGMRAEGLSLRAIVTECGRAGVVNRAGRPLQRTTIARILRAA